ncbi:GTPase IMAP family member 9-like [Siphateles boraxobius]|uniref:GTPase IMAP family member 9-like n=1 Tax=Siphateles boraxobius TaxID=180520 RepID=UPI004062EC57
MMKLTKTKPKLLFTLILAFHIMSVQTDASHDDDDDVRILIVGMRGDSRFSAAEILSGRKDGGQEDREIVKTPVITDEGRRMMLVTGPNLCEDDTARQSFTTALFLSAPGPHAVLMLLNLEDQESEECDVVKRVQDLLGAEVLQYCIVLLQQNHQERLTGASRGIAGEMINACGGRFHMIRDSEPKPAQTAALVAEIHKLVQLNAHRFYSQTLKTEETSQDVHEENQLLSVIYDTLGGDGNIGWISLVSFTALVVYTEGNDNNAANIRAYNGILAFND